MFFCEKLNKISMSDFQKLNRMRLNFNELNNDFFDKYNNTNLLNRFILKSRVILIRDKNEYLGYLWKERGQKHHYKLNSFYLENKNSILDAGDQLLRSFRKNSVITYECSKNSYNYLVLEELGFTRQEGVIELQRPIESTEPVELPLQVSFEAFVRGKHENLRCKLQNEIFMDNSREPITIDDIYYDVMQDYFMERGSVFIKYADKYIGYGQIILDGATPTVVNFGILKDYRRKGFGKLLLCHLINVLHSSGYRRVKLKVDPDNITAYRLYSEMGFSKTLEYYKYLKVT